MSAVFEDMFKGNRELKTMCCKVVVQILVNQQDRTRRDSLTQ